MEISPPLFPFAHKRKFAGKVERYMKNLSIIIPVFNEEARIYRAFEELERLSLPRGLRLNEIIFVNDGSKDNTLELLRAFKKSHRLPVRIITYTQNRGKGFAVRLGMLKSRSSYALLTDADMSTPFSEIEKFMPYVEKNEDIIIGTRKNGKSTVIVHQPKIRELMGKSFTKLTRIALNLDITDFTCGFKLFSSKAIFSIFPKTQIDGWGYDAEIIYLAHKQGFKINEKAVIWSDVADSHVNIKKATIDTSIEISRILITHAVLPYINKINIPRFSFSN